MNGCIPESLCNGNTVFCNKEGFSLNLKKELASSQKQPLFPHQTLNKSVFLLSPNIFIAKRLLVSLERLFYIF